MRAARVDIAAPGAQPTNVVRAPFAVAPESKRAVLVERQEQDLKAELIKLEDGTKARNRELQRQLNAIEQRGNNWETKFRAEEQQQQQAHADLVEFFQSSLIDCVEQERASLRHQIAEFQEQTIPPVDQHVDRVEREMEVFVHETVPAVIDRQSGIVSRKLRKAHDTFDIENAKVMKREQKIIARYERHATRTAQAFEDERATRSHKFMLLEEQIRENERTDDRQEARIIHEIVEEILKIRAELQQENETREKEDNTLLDAMLFAQQRLQTTVLESFGAEAHLELADQPPDNL